MRVLVPSRAGGGVRIRSTGSYLPARVVTNDDLVALGAPLTADEIVRLSGIRERRWAGADEATSDLAAKSCRAALARAKIEAQDVDRLILGTVSPDHLSPSAACFVQRALGMGEAPAFDLTASCSGFLFALDVAARAVLTGDRAVLACAADVRSRFLDLGDRATCALFGDGAGAAVIAPAPAGEGLLGIGLGGEGEGGRSVYVPAGGSRSPATAETVARREHTIRMQEGPQVYLAAIGGMIAAAEALLGALGKSWSDVDLVVPHQPNRRILDRMAKLAKIPPEKMYVNVERIGNVSGATCAIALDEAIAQGRIAPGDHVLLLAGGAGYTAGAALFVADEELVVGRAP
jgi:3-oxoacyl-[acyl-carrier-protein] synthase III